MLKGGSGCSGRGNSEPRLGAAGLRAAAGLITLVLAQFALSACVLDLGEPIPDTAVTVPPPLPSLPDAASTLPMPTSGTDDLTDDFTPDDDPSSSPSDTLDADVPPFGEDSGLDASMPPDPDDSGPNDVDATPGCPPGFVSCESGCVAGESCEPVPPPCSQTCALEHASEACVGELCTLVECEPGWVDCDGAPENGCEAEFGTAVPVNPTRIPRLTTNNEAGWAGVPVVPLEQPCGDCGQDFSGLPEQTPVFEDDAPAPLSDLRVGMSLGWSDSGLSLRAVVFDDDVVVGTDPDGVATTDARLYDHLHVVFDGETLGSSTDSQDHHLFIGLDGTPFDQRIPNTEMLRERVSVSVEPLGQHCQVLRARMSRDYLSGGDSLTLAAGNDFGFAVSFNDFDHGAAELAEVQREHQVFYLSPGPDYVYGPRNLPLLELVESLNIAADAGVP